MGFQLSRRAAITAGLVVAVVVPSISAGQSVIRGILYDDATGTPLRGTVMLVDPATDAAVVHTATDSVGFFSLQARDGRYQIAAIRPGYTSVLSAPVPLQNGERLTVRIPIAENGDPVNKIGVLERIRPNASSENRARVNSYEARRASGAGMQYDRGRLEKTGFLTLGQFLQTVPGVMVRDPASANSMQMSRSSAMTAMNVRGAPQLSCRVGWFLDGRRIDLPGRTDPLTDGLASIPLETIEAVEVFRGLSEMPTEFAAADLRCGAVAIWSRKS